MICTYVGQLNNMVNPSKVAQLSWLHNVSEVEKETNWWASHRALITTGVNINFNNTTAGTRKLETKPRFDLKLILPWFSPPKKTFPFCCQTHKDIHHLMNYFLNTKCEKEGKIQVKFIYIVVVYFCINSKCWLHKQYNHRQKSFVEITQSKTEITEKNMGNQRLQWTL